MPKFKDLTGQTFGTLTVKSRIESPSGRVMWSVICKCGKEKICRSDSLKNQCSCKYLNGVERKKWKWRNTESISGKNNYNWKGGKPDCENCGDKLSIYKSKTGLCKGCSLSKVTRNYKHGLSKNKKEYEKYRQSRLSEIELKKLSWQKNKRNRVLKRIQKQGLSHSFEEWETLKKEFGYKCLDCKLTEPEIKLTIDHIVPLTKGGDDLIENIQPLCRSCNSKKRNKIINFKLKTCERL